MSWLKRYWLKLFFLAVSGGLAAGIFMTSIWGGSAHGSNETFLVSIGSIMTVAVVLVAATETALNEREKEQARKQVVQIASDMATAYNQTLRPVSEALGEMAHKYTQANPPSSLTNPISSIQLPLASSLIRTVVVSAAVLAAGRDVTSQLPRGRSAFYRLTDRTNHEFTLEDWAGHFPAPRQIINGAEGSHLLHDIIDRNAAYHVGRATGLASKVDQSGARYRSVIAVPVLAGGSAFGVLTVDAPDEDDLEAIHVELLRSLAGFVGAALALT